MRDVLVLCEGQTEREFCRNVLAEYVAASGIALAGMIFGRPHRKRGGMRPWAAYRSELVRLAKERADRYVGLLVDFYAMPSDWPGRTTAVVKPLAERGKYVESELRGNLGPELGHRFLPCVQLHEFEALLFVSPDKTALSLLGAGSEMAQELQELTEILARAGGNVEEIDDSPSKAPSKRLKRVFPDYDKVAAGVAATQEAGVDVLRAGCPWLDRWLRTILELGPPAAE